MTPRLTRILRTADCPFQVYCDCKMDSFDVNPHELFSVVTILSSSFTVLFYLFLSPFLSPYFIKSYSSWTTSNKNYWNTIPYAIIHSVVIVSLSIWALLDVEKPLQYQIIFHSDMAKFGLQFSLGYFVGDLIVMLSNRELRADRKMLFHHLGGLISVGLGLVYSGCYTVVILLRLISEISTPFVNLRWLIAETNVPQTSLTFRINGLLMTFTFFCSRVFMIPIHWYILGCFLLYEQFPSSLYYSILPAKCWSVLVCLVFDSLNLFWAKKMWKGLMKHFFSSKKS